MKNSEKTPKGELGRAALGPGCSVYFCSVIGFKSEDHVSSSTLCKLCVYINEDVYTMYDVCIRNTYLSMGGVSLLYCTL